MHRYLWLCFCILLTGCGTPISKMEESDFFIQSSRHKQPIEKVKKTFLQGLIFCGPEIGGTIFVTHIGSPICRPEENDTKNLICDIYTGFPNASNIGNSRGILGRVDFIDQAGESLVIFRRKKIGSEASINSTVHVWNQILEGHARNVCARD